MISNKFILMLGIIFNCTTVLPALSECNVTISSVNFGSYDVFDGSNETSTGSIFYNCSSATPVPTSITIDLSQGNGLSYTPRKLTFGSNYLNYNLYLDAAGSQIWGDGTNSDHYISSTLTDTVTIYGIIPARQNAKVGNYTDSITATVNF
ncbi:Csu type fimbrial protein [Nostoc sp.]|uniref:Csu type fimbrial protein n=1 Tax=Nostoc sp. TaxID=1180 RepID=UPI002FF97379